MTEKEQAASPVRDRPAPLSEKEASGQGWTLGQKIALVLICLFVFAYWREVRRMRAHEAPVRPAAALTREVSGTRLLETPPDVPSLLDPPEPLSADRRRRFQSPTWGTAQSGDPKSAPDIEVLGYRCTYNPRNQNSHVVAQFRNNSSRLIDTFTVEIGLRDAQNRLAAVVTGDSPPLEPGKTWRMDADAPTEVPCHPSIEDLKGYFALPPGSK